MFWQTVGSIVVWAYVVALHRNNDGLWYQGDAARHAVNGLFWWDFLGSVPVNPLDFALSYYARYPVINPTAYPPVFYLLEGAAYRLFGFSPFVAKGLVLGFVLVGTFYLVAWLRRWVAEAAGWAGMLFALQPAIITWGHAVMLNVPSVALGVAALYHWRRWLEDLSSRQIYLASAFGSLAVLTYELTAVVALVMLGWALAEGRARVLVQGRTLMAAGVSLTLLVPWALVATTWVPSHRMIGFYWGDYPPWKLVAWTYYLEQIPRLVTIPLLFTALASMGLGVWKKRWRREISLALIWFGVCYVWYSAISMKEPRYVLLLIPPTVCLGAVGIVGGLQWFAEMLGQKTPRLILAGLMFLLFLHLGIAPSVRVPHVTGFREIVTFLRTIAPDQRVFYDGHYNGVFSFYLRADDDRFKRGVMLGSKLLYATRILPKYGLTEQVSSPADVVDLLRRECGCKFLVVERQISEDMMGVQAAGHLRQALTGVDFRLVRSFRVEAFRITDVDVYEYLGVVSIPHEFELRFPFLGDGVTFHVKPIER